MKTKGNTRFCGSRPVEAAYPYPIQPLAIRLSEPSGRSQGASYL
jgi:hypothetical protein